MRRRAGPPPPRQRESECRAPEGRWSRLLAPFSQAAHPRGGGLARRVLGGAEGGGDLVVRKVEAVAKDDGGAFLRRQLVGHRSELGPMTDELPPKERAAVVLRYGFDLPYDEIAAALGSSEDAARQAASSGVRRLRERSKQS